MVRMPGVAALAAALAILVTTPLSAQSIHGRTIEADSGRAITDVVVTLFDASGKALETTLSDSTGWFLLKAPKPGSYTLHATHIGYVTTRTPAVKVDPGQEVLVEVRMGTHAIPLKPLVVLQHVGAHELPLEELAQRMAENRAVGIGKFITREQIERRRNSRMSDILNTLPRVERRTTGAYRSTILLNGTRGPACVPLFFIDGTKINEGRNPVDIDDYVSPSDVEGVEVYSGTAEMPAAYYDQSQCGVVLIWTRRADVSRPANLGPTGLPTSNGSRLPRHLTDVLTPQLAVLGLGMIALFLAGLRP